MRNTSLMFFLVLLSFCGVAQENSGKLEELQKPTDELEYGVGGGDDTLYREIEFQINALKSKYDSLVLQHDLLKIEALVYQAKLAACTNNRNTLEETLESERASSFQIVNVDSNNSGNGNNNSNNVAESHLKKGWYIVLGSFRTYSKTKELLDEIAKDNKGMNLIVVQNLRKSWFHVCVDDPFTNEISGQKVSEIRAEGFDDAWSILLE